nr:MULTISPECIES: hypothetical protein [unclassified Kitasatospora]
MLADIGLCALSPAVNRGATGVILDRVRHRGFPCLRATGRQQCSGRGTVPACCPPLTVSAWR